MSWRTLGLKPKPGKELIAALLLNHSGFFYSEAEKKRREIEKII
jgi:hypothetical protein